MNSRLQIGAYWGPRCESAEACVRRCCEMFAHFSHINVRLVEWYHKTRSQRERGTRIDVSNTAQIRGLLNQGRHKSGCENECAEDLGTIVALWNGAQVAADAMDLTITCGAYHPTIGNNAVFLSLPPTLGTLGAISSLRHTLLAVALSFEPEWAGLFSSGAMCARPFVPSQFPFVDWMLYLDGRRYCPVEVPVGSLTERVENGGYLIIVDSTLNSGGGSDHIRYVRDVQRTLGIPLDS